MKPVRQLWWLNPVWTGGVLGMLVSLATLLVPEAMYRNYWRTPLIFNRGHLLICLACAGMFALGALAGNLGIRREQVPADPWHERIPWRQAERLFSFCFWATILGYVIWFSAAIARGARLPLMIQVLKGEKGASFEMKEVYMATISGVTTLTQFGIAAVVLGVMIGVAVGWRRVAPRIGVLFLLAVVRALFNTERLAVIELAIPVLVIAVRLLVLEARGWSLRMRMVLRIIPVFGAGLLVGMFSIFEYFRSWTTYYAGGSLGFWEFNIFRLLGYYATALNNGALLVERIETLGAPFFTFHFLFKFPGLSYITGAIYPDMALANADTDIYMQILAREANPEFNNGGGLLLPLVDYGLPGALIFWLVAGIVSGTLYRSYRQGGAAGLMLYPVFFIGVIELSRILYWGEGRIVPVYLALIPFAIWCAVWHRRKIHAEQRELCLQSH